MPTYTPSDPIVFQPLVNNIEQSFRKAQTQLNELYGIASEVGALNLSGTKRQSVLSAHVDASGNPDYLTVSGLTVSIDGSVKPIYLAFANGFNDSGSVDALDKISSLVSNAWTLPANQTTYLYIDKDLSTGLLSYGNTLLPDQYLKSAPSSPVLTQHYYNTNETKMYEYNGSTFAQKLRIFVAKAVTNSTTTTLTIYPLRSRNPIVAEQFSDGTTMTDYVLIDPEIGEIKMFPYTSPPTSYIKSNGALISRTGYPKLWAAAQSSGNITTDTDWSTNKKYGSFSTGDGSTTFRIPDYRGYFPRFWDDSRGIDTGRVTGTSQDDDSRSHSHLIARAVARTSPATGSDIILYGDGSLNYSSGATGGTETRPKNIAVLACIRYQ